MTTNKDYEKYINSNVYDDMEPIIKSKASRTFVGWNGDNTVKSSFSRNDYNYFRDTVNGNTRPNILKMCQEAYDNVGIIKNVIDLMADFGSKGIKVRHPDKDINKFCEKWFEKVSGQERSERFLNILYRLGSTVVYENTGRATNSSTSKYIPIGYTFLNPSSIEVKGQNSGYVPSSFEYVIRYTQKILRQPNSEDITSIIPEDLKKYKDGVRPLPKNKLSVYNYRKDDWQFWGWPITFPLLNDLKTLEKLKLSDIAALDGVISSVRLWTVGRITDNTQTTFLPTKPMLQKVRDMISQGVGGGSMDLVFGPELDFKESSTTAHQFLGEAKYKPTLDAIYDGLGIPSPLRSSNKDNNSASAISLKTLIERLNYGRMYLVDFWKNQLKKIFNILGFETDEDPIVEFDYMILTDEAAEKKLLLDMIDRDIIDIDTVHERFKLSSKIIKPNLKEEVIQRGNDLPAKSSPYHNPHVEDEMKKMLLQSGQVTPEEIGLDINVESGEQKTRFIVQQNERLSNKQFSDTPGRPPNITETTKRQPKSNSRALVWASNAQKQISDYYTPIVLKLYNKKNVRSLSVEETQSLEWAKASILLGMEPFSDISEETIIKAMEKETKISELKEFISSFKDMKLTVEQTRQLLSIFYASNLE